MNLKRKSKAIDQRPTNVNFEISRFKLKTEYLFSLKEGFMLLQQEVMFLLLRFKIS